MLTQQMVIIVHGIVQGVGFRATTKRFADQLRLNGYVKNRMDGTVEICALGEEAELKKLVVHLQETFTDRYIQKMDIEFSSPSRSYHGFKIESV